LIFCLFFIKKKEGEEREEVKRKETDSSLSFFIKRNKKSEVKKALRALLRTGPIAYRLYNAPGPIAHRPFDFPGLRTET
jgi:hypothetical protein